MAKSIAQAQRDYIKTVHLSEIGESKVQPAVELDEIEKGLIELAILFKDLAQKNLDAKDAISSNALAESIQFDQVKFMGGVYSVDINVLDYYKFVDKGVKGVQGGGDSPYKFKNLRVSKGMQESIRKWLIREGLKVRTREALNRPIGAERKGARFSNVDKTRSFAYAVATNIKKKGLRATNFWTDAEKGVNEKIHDIMGHRFTVAIVNELTKK